MPESASSYIRATAFILGAAASSHEVRNLIDAWQKRFAAKLAVSPSHELAF